MNSNDLKIKLDLLRKQTLANHNHWVFEPNSFDKLLNNIILNIFVIIKLIFKNKMIKKIFTEIYLSLKDIFEILFGKKNLPKSNNKNNLELENLEKKLDSHLELYQNSIVENRQLKKEISNLHGKIEKYLAQNKINLPNDLGHNSNSRVDFYQEENVRLGSELLDTKKKFEILRNEIEKYEQQRSNIISKINSVNDALQDTNVLTNIFDNDVKPKVNIVDHQKINKQDKAELNKQVSSIFSSK